MAKVAIMLEDGVSMAMATAHTASTFNNGGKLVVKWDVNEVAQWLASIGFADVAPIFQKHCISGPTLPKLNDALLKEMGIEIVGRRLLLITEVIKIQAIARAEWRNEVLWASEQYRPGPCNNSLPFGFPFPCASCVGRPDMYTLTNSKFNVFRSTKNCNTPCTGFCGFSISSDNMDLTTIREVDAVASTNMIGDPLGFVVASTNDGKVLRLHLRSSQCQKACSLISNAKEECIVAMSMQMLRN